MPDTTLLRLLYKLLDRTKEGKITWSETRSSTSFFAPFSGYSVRITERDDPEYPDKPDYVLSIVDDEGREVETASNIDLDVLADEKPLFQPHPYSAMQELYIRARRIALGTDRALQSLLKQLGDDEE